MKKNVIYILVDALCEDNIGPKKYKYSATPFLDEIKKKSTSCNKMFSSAPYTEAAFISNLCGENTLDNGGYLLGLSSTRLTMPYIFKSNGYSTIASFSPYIYSDSYIKGVDKFYYTRIFSINPLILYRINYYRNIYINNGQLRNLEIELCYKLLSEALDTWYEQIQSIKEKKESTILIYDLIENLDEIELILNTLKTNKEALELNSKEFLYELFNLWEDHSLLQVNNLKIENKISNQLKEKLDLEYSFKLNTIQNKINRLNKINLKLDIPYLFDLSLKSEYRIIDAYKTLKTYHNIYSDKTLKDYLKKPFDKEKITVSAHRQLNQFAKKIIELDKKNINYFSFLHLEDFHLPSMFFSYDIEDETIIKNELDSALDYIDTIPSSYKGNIISDLSAHYIDLKLKQFFDIISNQLDNEFILVITADHGYPCNFLPPRPLIYNSLYNENYHIPFIVYDSSNKKMNQIRGLHTSVDILPTILQYANIENIPPHLSSYTLDKKSRDYICIEYPGPGCPDISKKKLFYSIQNNEFKIDIKASLDQIILYENIVGIYNLKNDPLEKKNLRKKMQSDTRIKYLLNTVNERHAYLAQKFLGEKFLEFIINHN